MKFKFTIEHKSGKTWEIETEEDMDNFYRDPLYDDDTSDFTFNGMPWDVFFKSVVLPLQTEGRDFQFDGFEEND